MAEQIEVYESQYTSQQVEDAMGAVLSIGPNGNWFIGENDTGVYAGGVKVEGAEVGQTIVVKAVNENGVPTEWEAAELPAGWEVINDITLTEDITNFVMNVDKDGNAFMLDAFEVLLYVKGLDVTANWYFYKTKNPSYSGTVAVNINLTTNATVILDGIAGAFTRGGSYQYGYELAKTIISREPVDSNGKFVSVPMDCFAFNNFADGAVMPAGTHIIITGRRSKT